ncbi:hypothetical protein B0H16DRAFT_1480051 [Mycena metata]|uniref:Uncharacterized protein n=1 Tax=Mycena metata TaxID=1033252 RepID=A0AAD7MD69_9AGAR|nr:hypothetical protein B0H16DRAFT_1480051 [Mycena metata]
MLIMRLTLVILALGAGRMDSNSAIRDLTSAYFPSTAPSCTPPEAAAPFAKEFEHVQREKAEKASHQPAAPPSAASSLRQVIPLRLATPSSRTPSPASEAPSLDLRQVSRAPPRGTALLLSKVPHSQLLRAMRTLRVPKTLLSWISSPWDFRPEPAESGPPGPLLCHTYRWEPTPEEEVYPFLRCEQPAPDPSPPSLPIAPTDPHRLFDANVPLAPGQPASQVPPNYQSTPQEGESVQERLRYANFDVSVDYRVTPRYSTAPAPGHCSSGPIDVPLLKPAMLLPVIDTAPTPPAEEAEDDVEMGVSPAIFMRFISTRICLVDPKIAFLCQGRFHWSTLFEIVTASECFEALIAIRDAVITFAKEDPSFVPCAALCDLSETVKFYEVANAKAASAQTPTVVESVDPLKEKKRKKKDTKEPKSAPVAPDLDIEDSKSLSWLIRRLTSLQMDVDIHIAGAPTLDATPVPVGLKFSKKQQSKEVTVLCGGCGKTHVTDIALLSYLVQLYPDSGLGGEMY